jgi:hypothetical protein
MMELKFRRDAGEPVHEILTEIAASHEVAVDELRKRAETSWGSPLEEDRHRNAAHFESIDRLLSDVVSLAKTLWSELQSRPSISFWRWDLHWKLRLWFEDIGLNSDELKYIAEEAFMDEIYRLKRERDGHA